MENKIQPSATLNNPPGSVPLRDYQQQAIAAIDAASARGRKRVLIQLPTGAGKTIVFAHLIARFVDNEATA